MIDITNLEEKQKIYRIHFKNIYHGKGDFSINDVPFYFVMIYGIFETIALSWFVLEMTNINYSINSLIKITALRLILILIIRNIFAGNLIIITLLGVLITIFITWLFIKKCIIKITIFTLLSVVITGLSEMISATFVQKYLHNISDNINWWLTGVPHILFLVIIPIIIKRGQLACRESGAGISEMH